MKLCSLLYAISLYVCSAGTNSFYSKDLILNDTKINQFADAVYRIEGGEKARKPYGILSVKVNNKQHARRICINSIKNNYKRWIDSGQKVAFPVYFAGRWCPQSVDPVGFRNWTNNARKILP